MIGRTCTVCAVALRPCDAATIGYVRFRNGGFYLAGDFAACPCCLARAKTHPAAVIPALRREYRKTVN